jgi:hypothetical protein
MPCNSDYLAASGQEQESQRVCQLLVYLYKKLQRETDLPMWVYEAASDYYGNVNRLDEATKMLCESCRGLTKKEQDSFIYDGHSSEARRLADWFARHQEWDKRRVAEEKTTRKNIILKQRALRKLSVEEIKALGLDKD